MNSNNSIEVRGISKPFSIIKTKPGVKPSFFDKKIEKKILDDISFNVKKGEVVGIIGRNGAGKSTLLKIIAKIMEPDCGYIEYNGIMATILELGMGFHHDMSGRENIYLKGELYGFSRKQLDEKIESIIDYSGVREYIDNPVRTYSSGMTGRLAFSILTHVDAEIVLVDEVLSTGDASFKSKAREHFKKMSRSGCTVLFVSHSITSMENMCSRVIWIEKGKIRLDGNAKEVCSAYRNAISDDPDIVMDLAKSDVPDSQYKLAIMYRDGNGLPKDYNQFLHWIEIAAKNRHTRAEVEYASVLIEDPSNRDEALNYLRDAANMGNEDARNKLATLMSSGEVDELRNALLMTYERLAESGDPTFEFRYADLLKKTSWSLSDIKKSFIWFKKAADEGNVVSMYQTGIMYRDGTGTAKDYDQMERYLLMAGDKGNIKSLMLMADYYTNGVYVARDENKGFLLYEKAAELGNNDARYEVAIMCSKGIGTVRDMDKSNDYYFKYAHAMMNNHCLWAGNKLLSSDKESSLNYFRRNVDYNNISSIIDVIRAYENKLIPEHEFKKALDRLTFLATNGNKSAIITLGNMYYNGYVVKKDDDEAHKWFAVGSQFDYAQCSYMLGKMHSDVNSKYYDKKQAIELFFKASELGYIPSLMEIIVLTYNDDQESYNRAFGILKNHAWLGRPKAMLQLGKLYQGGKYVEKDLNEAMKWYEMGEKCGSTACSVKKEKIHTLLDDEDDEDE